MIKVKKPRIFSSLAVLFTLIVFLVLMATMIIMSLLLIILIENGIIQIGSKVIPSISLLVAFYGISSVIIGTIICGIVARIPTRPVKKLVSALDTLASGNFSVRLDMGENEIFQNVANSFNDLAEELQNTEMLRSDFINNFSHEFKTPIVSIYGFARLINRGATTPEQTDEYLRIIEEESARLSSMATNVLNMTKVENQTIVGDVSEYNLSEQIRTAILLLEKKWTQKNIDISLEFDEYNICADQELLKQVWINIIDNAIKFTPANGIISVNIINDPTNYVINILNTGSYISPDEIKKIFNKFYQSDTSHASEGTGIGLAVVKKIVSLHHGKIDVHSNNNFTCFSISLPKSQS